jgi:tRNA(fMet)-specific endonuclease VapC
MRPEDLEADAILLDTNVFSRLGANDPAYEKFRPFTIGRFVFLSFVTVGEVLRGAFYAGFGPRRMAAIEDGLRAYGALPGNAAAAVAYARIWARLRQAGTPVGDHDIWIAATALVQDPPLPVMTNDGDFEAIAAVSSLVIVRPDGPDRSV